MRVVSLLVLSILAASCKKSAEAPTIPITGPKDAAVTVQSFGDATLSMFEPTARGCEWRRFDPITKASQTLTTVPGDCKGVRVAFDPEVTRALVWIDPRHVQHPGFFADFAAPSAHAEATVDETRNSELFLVNIQNGERTQLSIPERRGDLMEIGLNDRGSR
jgi:hypothetical protein